MIQISKNVRHNTYNTNFYQFEVHIYITYNRKSHSKQSVEYLIALLSHKINK